MSRIHEEKLSAYNGLIRRSMTVQSIRRVPNKMYYKLHTELWPRNQLRTQLWPRNLALLKALIPKAMIISG